MNHPNINCWYCGAEQKEFVEYVSTLKAENERWKVIAKWDDEELANKVESLTKEK